MKINVKVPEELAAQAEALGLPLEAYVEQILAQQIREHKAEGANVSDSYRNPRLAGFIGPVFRQNPASPRKNHARVDLSES